MSLAHYIALQNKNPGFDTFVNGKAIAHACDELEAIAKAENVTPIMEFYGRKWHHAEAGLATVHALVRHLMEKPKSVADAEYVIDDLKGWEEVLLKAKAAGIKWKMNIDY